MEKKLLRLLDDINALQQDALKKIAGTEKGEVLQWYYRGLNDGYKFCYNEIMKIALKEKEGG